MKLDIKLIKRILNAMTEQTSHYVSVKDISEIVKEDYPELEKDDFNDLFIGHLYLLKDNGVVKEILGDNLGTRYTINNGIIISTCFIRLTSSGYDYLKMLNKNGFLEKVKNLTLTEGQKIGELLLIEGIKNFIT